MELRDGRHDDSVEEALCRIIQEAGFGQQEELKNVIMCSECWRESEGLHVCAPPVSTWPRRLDLFAVLSAWIRPTYRATWVRWNCCVSDATTNRRSPLPVTSFQSPEWSVWTTSCPVPAHNRRCESGTPYPITLSVPVLRIQSSTATTAICISGWYEAKSQLVFAVTTAVAQLQHLQPGYASSPVPASIPESRPPPRLRDTPKHRPRIRSRHTYPRRYAGRRPAPSVGLWPSKVVGRVRQRQRTFHISPRKTSQFPTIRPQGSRSE